MHSIIGDNSRIQWPELLKGKCFTPLANHLLLFSSCDSPRDRAFQYSSVHLASRLLAMPTDADAPCFFCFLFLPGLRHQIAPASAFVHAVFCMTSEKASTALRSKVVSLCTSSRDQPLPRRFSGHRLHRVMHLLLVPV